MAGLHVTAPEPGVALVAMDRAGRLNAWDEATVRALPEVFQGLADDADVRAVVLTGAHGAFSAGGDLEVLQGLPQLSAEDLEFRLLRAFQASALLREMNKPVIAAISGPAAGGGLGLALACDVRIAGTDATFVSTFINLGIAPDYGTTWLLPRLVGHGLALDMALSGRRVGAEEAHAAGLVTRIASDPLAEAILLAGRIAAQSATAVALTKRLLRDSAALDFASALAVEAREQTAALHSSGFADRWSAWRAEVASVKSGRA